MKKLLLFVIVLMFPFLSEAKLVIKGKLGGTFGKTIENITIDCGNKIIPVKVEKNLFQAEINIENSQFIILNITKVPLYLYAEPDRNIEVDINIESGSELFYSSKNTKDYPNILLSEVNNEIKKIGFIYWGDVMKNKIGRMPIEPIKQIQALYNNYADELEKNSPSFKEDYNLAFKSLEGMILSVDETEKQIEQRLENILSLNYDGNRLYTIPYFIPYFQMLTKIKTADELSFYGFDYDSQKDKEKIAKTSARAIISYSPARLIKDRLLTEMLGTELQISQAKNEGYVDYLIENIENKKSITPLLKKYEDAKNKKKVVNGELPAAFNFNFVDVNGKNYTLDDFKGKLVYIDCWASWCAPCRGQIPHLKALEKEYEGQNIAFLSVSLDNTSKDWLKGVQEEKLQGYVLHADGAFKNPFPKYYGINAIPRFLLISADGKMINDDMPKPQQLKETKNIIDKYLYISKGDEIIKKHLSVLQFDRIKDKMIKFDATSSVMGIGQKIVGHTNFEGQKEMTSEAFVSNDAFKILLGESFFKPVKTISDMKSKTKYQGTQEVKDESMFICPEGYEIAYLLNRGYKIDIDGASLDEKAKEYVFTCNDNGTFYKFCLDKKTLLISKLIVKYKTNREEGGGYFEVTMNYTDYAKSGDFYYVKEMNTMGMIKQSYNTVEFVPNNPSLFRIK